MPVNKPMVDPWGHEVKEGSIVLYPILVGSKRIELLPHIVLSIEKYTIRCKRPVFEWIAAESRRGYQMVEVTLTNLRNITVMEDLTENDVIQFMLKREKEKASK